MFQCCRFSSFSLGFSVMNYSLTKIFPVLLRQLYGKLPLQPPFLDRSSMFPHIQSLLYADTPCMLVPWWFVLDSCRDLCQVLPWVVCQPCIRIIWWEWTHCNGHGPLVAICGWRAPRTQVRQHWNTGWTLGHLGRLAVGQCRKIHFLMYPIWNIRSCSRQFLI